jgi:hypothetical protein
LEHNISPEFMREELSNSIKRIGGGPPLSYLIDSPERFLQDHVEKRSSALRKLAEATAVLSSTSAGGSENSSTMNKKKTSSAAPPPIQLIGLESSSKANVSKAQKELDQVNKNFEIAKEELYTKLKSTFYSLELEKEKGTILNYGICSDAHALPDDDPLHLDWKKIMNTVNELNHDKLTTKRKPSEAQKFLFQLPINILEPLGAKVAQQIHAFKLSSNSSKSGGGGGSNIVSPHVMGTRPLTAILPLSLNTEGANERQLMELLSASSSSSTWQRLVDFEVKGNGLDPLAQEGGYMSACQVYFIICVCV